MPDERKQFAIIYLNLLLVYNYYKLKNTNVKRSFAIDISSIWFIMIQVVYLITIKD